jgi:ATP-dependent DNA helicase DinG
VVPGPYPAARWQATGATVVVVGTVAAAGAALVAGDDAADADLELELQVASTIGNRHAAIVTGRDLRRRIARSVRPTLAAYRGGMPRSDPHVAWRADPTEVLAAAVRGFGGEQRDGQMALSAAVADAIGAGHHLVAEAPTGSGKSLAYLAPAVASGLKIVVATSTIALQSQLVSKDLPALQEHVDVPFTFVLLKGRSNYLCRAKLRAAAAPDALFEQPVSVAFPQHLHRLRAFAEESETGDRAEVDDDIPNATWAAVSCSSGECPGRANCDDGADCFAERARDLAQGASILVVNHALYCAHLAADGRVLPEHDVVILDEAHSFADNATNAFAGDIAADALVRLAGMLGRAGVERSAVEALTESGKKLSKVIESRTGAVDAGRDEELGVALVAAAERLAAANGKLDKSDDYAKRTAQLANGRLEVLRRLAAPDADDVVWVDAIGRSRRLRIAPVAPGDLIGHRLLDQRPVIAVSATLGGEPPFAAVAFQLGLQPARAPGGWGDRDEDGRLTSNAGRGYAPLQTLSSFDWKEQGLLYVGRDMPDPGRERAAWLEEAGERLCQLVNAAGGRALVLCTSHANVGHFAEVLRSRTTHEVLAQGDADTGRLAREFLDDETSVLVGTRSFWGGIDAAGVACVLVVIDKIPFPVPDDPMHMARRARAQERDIDPFNAVDIPAAALVLAQGAGRLIRRRADRGVVAVFDSRLATRQYKTQLLAAMPPFRRSISLEQACAFLAEATGGAAPVRPAVSVAVEHEPADIRDDLMMSQTVAIRDATPCPVCGADLGERCRGNDGTLAFLHDARVRGAAD